MQRVGRHVLTHDRLESRRRGRAQHQVAIVARDPVDRLRQGRDLREQSGKSGRLAAAALLHEVDCDRQQLDENDGADDDKAEAGGDVKPAHPAQAPCSERANVSTEEVAAISHGPDRELSLGIRGDELAAQPAHRHVNDAVERIRGPAARPVEQLVA